MDNLRQSRCGGFTLVEILIVVLLLAIIASIVVPQFSNASATARASMLADDLRTLRSQIQVFKGQHHGISPGYPKCNQSAEPTAADFESAMIHPSDAAGNVDTEGTLSLPFGPYLSKIPVNPINNKDTVRVLKDNEDFPSEPSGNDGWLYKPSTTEFKSDCLGADDKKVPYFDY